MQLADFHFDLPPELIAQYPAHERSASRLLHVDSKDTDFKHLTFSDISSMLHPGDLLVFNNTKVIPARLFGQKTTGGRIEIFLERILPQGKMLAQMRASKSPKLNDELLLPRGVRFKVLAKYQQFYELQCISSGDITITRENDPILDIIETIGHIPLPPYMHREAEESDKERYQTVYAKHHGSVAAPTAGFHFDHPLLERLTAKGVQLGYLTLHIGAGTYLPVKVENLAEHQMHAEYIEVNEALCEQIIATKKRGNRVIVVGTTTLRALETACQGGSIAPFIGDTDIFILPGFQFKSADVLITNLHLPHSTLLMLVAAFGGYDTLIKAYQEAVQKAYRFYSYGDAMWIERAVIAVIPETAAGGCPGPI